MVTLQGFQGHTGLTHLLYECQKIKKGGLDQYDAKRFGQLIFAIIRKTV